MEIDGNYHRLVVVEVPPKYSHDDSKRNGGTPSTFPLKTTSTPPPLLNKLFN
jgi:hypothetical protein